MARRRSGDQPPVNAQPHHEIIQRPMDEVMHISMIPYVSTLSSSERFRAWKTD